MKRFVGLLLLFVAVSLCAAAADPAQPVRVLLVTGGHDHELSFYEMFLAFKGYEVNVNPHPKAFRANMDKKYDVVVLYDMLDFPEDEKPFIRKYLEAGKGIEAPELVALGHEMQVAHMDEFHQGTLTCSSFPVLYGNRAKVPRLR